MQIFLPFLCFPYFRYFNCSSGPCETERFYAERHTKGHQNGYIIIDLYIYLITQTLFLQLRISLMRTAIDFFKFDSLALISFPYPFARTRLPLSTTDSISTVHSC